MHTHTPHTHARAQTSSVILIRGRFYHRLFSTHTHIYIHICIHISTYIYIYIYVYIYIDGKTNLITGAEGPSTGEEGHSTGRAFCFCFYRTGRPSTFNGTNERSHGKQSDLNCFMFCKSYWIFGQGPILIRLTRSVRVSVRIST